MQNTIATNFRPCPTVIVAPVPIARRCFSSPRRGLTFIELMFATMILGLGMIIIASVFPVAIGEQRATIDAAAASTVERNAARIIDAAASTKAPLGTQWLTPSTAGTGTVSSLASDVNIWDRIKGDLIDKVDPRYAWTGMYEREIQGPLPEGDNRVTLFIATLTSNASAAFDASPSGLDKLMPIPGTIDYIVVPGADPDFVRIANSGGPVFTPVAPGLAPTAVRAACEGAFLIRSTGIDPTAANAVYPNDVILKLGNRRADMDTPGKEAYEIAPGFEYTGLTPIGSGAGVFVVGKDPTVADGPKLVISCRAVTIDVPDPG